MNSKQGTNDLGISDRIRRSQGRLARNTMAAAKVTREEREELDAAARAQGKTLSEWARQVLIDKARTGPTETALFTELIALRLLANNVLRALALGRTMTEKEFAQVMAEIRSNKHNAAGEVLTQYQNRNGEQ